MDKEQNVEHFLSLIRKAKRGHLKIYIGMSAGSEKLSGCYGKHMICLPRS